MKWQGYDYEVIILGSGLGGLIAGAYLSKEHHRVLLLKEKQYHYSYQEKAYRFSPFSNFSEKLIRIAPLARVSKELGLPLSKSGRGETKQDEQGRERRNRKVPFQVILPKARIDLFFNRSMLQMELKREFPKEIVQIESFYDKMEELNRLFLMKEKAKGKAGSFFPIKPRSLISKVWPFNGLIGGQIDKKLAPFSMEFKKFIQLQLISLGNLLPDRFPTSLTNYLLSHDGIDELVSDIDSNSLKEKILEKFLQSGGRIEEIGAVDHVEKKWRKGIHLLLKGQERPFRSRIIIFNSPLYSLSKLLGKKEGGWLLKWDERIFPKYVLIPLFLGIREKVVPVGMRDLLVSILDLNKPYDGGNLLFLHLSHKGDENEAPDGRRSLTVESLMIPQNLDSDSFAEHQRGVMEHLNHLFPYLDEYVELMNWDWINKQFSCWSYPHFLYETDANFQWRTGVIPHQISKDIYFIGKENFPYLGTEGEILSGLMVTQQILKRYL